MEIRTLSEQDVEIYVPLRLRALKEEPESFGEAFEEASLRTRESMADLVKKGPDSFVLGVFAGNELVGTLGLFRKRGMKVRHQGVIWGMYITPERRGHGWGKRLLSAAIDRARLMNGLEQIHLSVVTTNRAARQIYEEAGFSTFALEKRALIVEGKYLDEEHMALFL